MSSAEIDASAILQSAGVSCRLDTISSPGSVAKQFTAAAVLLLAREGKLSLDDPATGAFYESGRLARSQQLQA